MNLNDIKDSNYVIYNMYDDSYINSLYNYPYFLFIKNLIKFFSMGLFHGYLSIKSLKIYFQNYDNKAVFFSLSKNNHNVLNPLYRKYKKPCLFLTTDYKNSNNKNLLFTKFIPFIFSLFFLPIKLINIPFLDKETRKRTVIFLHEYLLSSGYNIFFKLFFKLNKVDKIIIANDHVQLTRIIVKNARKYNIKTYYLQNGCITPGFPILTTNYALVEGQYSKDIYKNKNVNNTVIKIIGMTKTDIENIQINNKTKIKKIGICSTGTMSYYDIKIIINYLKENYRDLKIILRPHPSEIFENKFSDYYNDSSILFSNSNKIHPIKFLEETDAIIAGNSAILLEAALLNVYPIYYFTKNNIIKYNDDNYDRYGFIKNKLAHSVLDLVALPKVIDSLIKHKPNIRDRANYYCDIKNNASLKAISLIENS
jgi:hypothetical protein